MLLSILFAIGVAGPDLRLEIERHSLTGTHYRYRQFIEGAPVAGGEVNVTVRPDGTRDEQRALALPPFGPRAKSAGGEWWVNAAGIARAARRFVVRDGVLVTHRYVDVETGAVLREDRLYYSAKPARVFEANPVAKLNAPELRDLEDSAAAVPDSAYGEVELSDVRASGPLGGPWVQIADFQAPFISPVDAAETLLFDRGDDRFEDVNAYFHIDRSQRHLQSLGYTGTRALVPYPVETDTHAAGGSDDSYFIISATDAGRGRLHFGEGGTDDAEDSDIVVHEYAHAIHEWISPGTFLGRFSSESRALSEGFSDYWAFSAGYAPATASGRDAFCLGDWDARCWSNPPGDQCAYPQGADCLRRMDSSKTIADFLHGESSGTEHRNGEIWSSALTEIFVALVRRHGVGEGRRATDTLVLESLFGTPPAPTFATIAARMIAADRYVSGGRNHDVICAAMTRRGILANCSTVPRGEVTHFRGLGSGRVVPDNDPGGLTLSAFVTDTRTIEKVMVAVNIRHRGRGELRLALLAPDGTVARLYEPSPERAPDLVTTFGRDSLPVDSLEVFRGRPANGEWRLRVVDVAFADVATVLSWSLIIQFTGEQPEPSRPFIAGHRQVVPVAGRTPGANGTFFSTDLRMLNASPRETEALLVFTPSVVDGRSEFAAVKVVLRPGEVFAADDVVRTLFASAGTGQLEIAGDLIASTRTWTPAGEGSSGLFAAALDAGSAIGAGQASRVFHLRNDEKFRSNIGFAEVSGAVARVIVRIGEDEIRHDVFPFSHLQVPVEARGSSLDALVTAEGEGRVVAYGATIDNRSGDAVFIPALPGPIEPGQLIPAISSPGAMGTRWRTDVAVTAPATMSYTTGSETITRELTESIQLEDVVASLFDRPGTRGTLAAAGFVSARIRTDGPHGTFGQFAPFLASVSTPVRHILHVESSPDFRTNIGLLSDTGALVRVTIFNGDGRPLVTSDHAVQPLQLEQFAVSVDVVNGRASIELLSGRVAAYGSIVDNRTGDPILVPAQ